MGLHHTGPTVWQMYEGRVEIIVISGDKFLVEHDAIPGIDRQVQCRIVLPSAALSYLTTPWEAAEALAEKVVVVPHSAPEFLTASVRSSGRRNSIVLVYYTIVAGKLPGERLLYKLSREPDSSNELWQPGLATTLKQLREKIESGGQTVSATSEDAEAVSDGL